MSDVAKRKPPANIGIVYKTIKDVMRKDINNRSVICSKYGMRSKQLIDVRRDDIPDKDKAKYIVDIIYVDVIVESGGYNVQPDPVKYSVNMEYCINRYETNKMR